MLYFSPKFTKVQRPNKCRNVLKIKCMAVKRDYKKILEDEKRVKVCQIAPATRVGVSEGFGLKPGEVNARQLVTSLRKLGFDYVFDTLFSADVTILEEGTEFLLRLKNGELKDRPLFTSCCPNWILTAESNFPEILPYISTTKSPQMILGSIIKHIFAECIGLQPKDIFSVSIMPCVKKQSEADRPMFTYDGTKDVDLVLTVVELIELFKEVGINPSEELETEFDNPFCASSGSAALFGRTGGVMIAALRFAYDTLTGETLDTIELTPLVEFPDILEAEITLTPTIDNVIGFPAEEITLKIAIIAGLGNAKKFIKAVLEGRMDHKFVEIMSCPSGCISGAGLPTTKDKDIIQQRKKALNNLDEKAEKKAAHENSEAQELYEKHLGKPGECKAHELFHTYYEPKKKKNDT
jgi:iron-only hydrogenase group A